MFDRRIISSMRGFTLIELVIVLAILAITAAISLGAYENYKQRQCARFAADQFVTDLRFAREQALVRSTNVLVQFSVNTGYSIYAGTRLTVAGVVNEAQKGTVIRTGDLRERYGEPLVMAPGAGNIVFDFRGTLNTTATVPMGPIDFGTVPGVTRRVTILATGFCRVEGGGG